MTAIRSRAVLTAFCLGGLAAAGRIALAEQPDEFFEKQVRPILVERCYECHSGKTGSTKGGLRLDSRAALLKGGDTGPAVLPGNINDSLLIDAINYGELYQMPPKSRLPAEEVAVLTKWVEMGAPWPAGGKEPGVGSQESGVAFDLAARKAEHWCWQAIRPMVPPAVKDEGWIRQPLDRFILAKLEERSLPPAPPADERTLIRRAYFDLIGLPPPVEKLAGQKYEVLVDELLASPHFGERWGRHWLDLVRYAESRGHEFDYTIPNAFEYRDYVIRALNTDVPYDQFLIEHVAGDLLTKPRMHSREGFNESIIGTGFWFLGEWVHSPVDSRKDECDRIDNMLDVFTKTFLGVTVACARCHDHKFDAISQRDYYALAGYLQSASYRLARFETSAEERAIAAELDGLDRTFAARIAAELAKSLQPRASELAKSLLAVEDVTTVFGVMESDRRGGKLIADFSKRSADEWMSDGPTFGSAPVVPGQLVMTGDAALPLEVAEYGSGRRSLAWPDLIIASGSENDSGRLAGWVRSGRTLKTPTFTLDSGYLHYLVEGVGHVYAVVDSHAMINGPLHAELLKETGGDGDLPMRWITHDLSRYVGHRLHLEFSPKEEDFRILMVVDGRERPGAPTARPNSLLERIPSVESTKERQIAARAVVEETLAQLAENRIMSDGSARDRAKVANWLVAQASGDRSAPPAISRLVADYEASRDKLVQKIRPASRVCLALWDGTPVDEHLLIRGNHKTVGPVVPRRLLEAFEGAAFGVQGPGGSGRLELAQRLVEPSNPLVSRVIVNRVWQHLMGRGIVASVDNFGVLGAKPSHPELLDYLAAEFVRDGWSLKRLIRRIMLSSVYRQESGGRSQESEAEDPENLLFHRQNVKRLEGEALRDAMLAVSGSLNKQMYGPSVPVYLTPFMQGRGRPKDSGPLDGDGRRSIYIAVRRNFLAPLMTAFDTPLPFTTIGRRNVSNVPAQALILMNDPFVVEQAKHWARRITGNSGESSEARIRGMYLAAFGREPSANESRAALRFLWTQTEEFRIRGGDISLEMRVWADLGHMLYNVKEFNLIE
jgi:hypothetical protein